jgi:DNA-binding NarL/FixJ family response regulator
MVGMSSRIGTVARRAQAPATAQVRVLLGAPQLMMRQALTAALGGHTRLRVVGDVGNGKDALRWALEVRPDITLLDQSLGPVDGVHAAFAIHTEDPALKLVLLSDGYVDPAEVAELEPVTAARVSKRLGMMALVDVLVRVAEGERPGKVPAGVVAAPLPVASPGHRLKPSEQVLLELLVDGNDNRLMAERLGCTEKTVRNRLSDLYAKLNLHNRTQAALYAIRTGLVDPLKVEA